MKPTNQTASCDNLFFESLNYWVHPATLCRPPPEALMEFTFPAHWSVLLLVCNGTQPFMSVFICLFVSAGRVLPEVLQYLRVGDGVCCLVLPGVPAALHSDAEQVHVPAHPAKRYRRGGHPPLLHHPHCGLPVSGREICRLREQLLGKSGVSSPSPASSADLLRDEAGPPLLRPADTWSDSEEVHTGVRPVAAFPLCGHGSFLPTGVLSWERDGRQAGVHKHPW